MATTDLRDRLQPALLDRLTDDQPERQHDADDKRVLNKNQLRQAVLRDLSWLFNAVIVPSIGVNTEVFRNASSACFNVADACSIECSEASAVAFAISSAARAASKSWSLTSFLSWSPVTRL